MRYLVLALLCWTTSVSFGQSVSMSKSQKFNSKKDLFEIGGWLEDRLMIYYSDKSKSYIDLYDANMERKAIVSLGFMPDAPKQVKLLPQKHQSIILYSAQVNSKEFFYAARLDKDSKIIGRPKSIDTAFQNFFGNTKLQFQLLHSSANNKVGVFSYRIKDSKLEYNLTIADDSLNIVHSSNGSLPTKSFYDVSQIMLRDDGKILVLATDLSTNKNDEVAEAIVYLITPEDKRKTTVKAFPFDFGEVFTGNIYLKEDISNTNLVHFAGLTKGKMGMINGLFSGKIDIDAENNSPVSGNAVPFDLNIETVISSERGRLGNFIIQDIVVKNDGGMILVSEAYSRIVRTNYSGPGYYGWGYGNMGTTRYVEYLYGNVLFLDVNANQKLNWFSGVPKWQHSVDDYGLYASFTLLNSGSALGMVYNEVYNKGYKVKSTIVGLDGQQETSEVATNMKSEGRWVPKLGKQTKAKEMVVPVLGGNKLQFAKVNY